MPYSNSACDRQGIRFKVGTFVTKIKVNFAALFAAQVQHFTGRTTMRISDSKIHGHHLQIGVLFDFETEQQHPVSRQTRCAKGCPSRSLMCPCALDPAGSQTREHALRGCPLPRANRCSSDVRLCRKARDDGQTTHRQHHHAHHEF